MPDRRCRNLCIGALLPSPQKILRILKNTLDQRPKMQVRTGRAPHTPHFGNFLPALDQVALFHKHSGRIRVTRDQLVITIDFHHVAVGRMVFLRHDYAARSSEYGGTGLGWKIQLDVQCRKPIERVNAPAKCRTEIAARHRSLGRQHHFLDLLVKQT
jgi:hypothetical protein